MQLGISQLSAPEGEVKTIRNSQFAIRNYNQWGLEPATDRATAKFVI